MSTSSARCRSVFVLWVGALFFSFPPLAVSARAEEPGASFIRLEWLSDLGAESIVAGESKPRTGRDPFVAVAPGAAYSFGLDTDGSLRKLNKLAADSSIPYGAAPVELGVNPTGAYFRQGSVLEMHSQTP